MKPLPNKVDTAGTPMKRKVGYESEPEIDEGVELKKRRTTHTNGGDESGKTDTGN